MLDVDALAAEIRRVDGSNSLGAGALAEALMPFIESRTTKSSSPLQWVEMENYWQGRGLGSHYDIYKDGRRWRVWLMHDGEATYYKSLELAKAACQAEYASRVYIARFGNGEGNV